jgi:DNA polymerase-3 subunit gamma/tau
MVEALEIKDIDAMIRGLEQELKGVEVSEIMVTTPTPDLSVPKEVITITEEEILSPESVERLALSAEKEKKEEVSPAAKEEPTSIPKTEPQSTEAIPSQQEEPLTAAQTPSESPTPQEESTKEEQPPLNAQRSVPQGHLSLRSGALNANLFDTLVKKIYDRDYDLGSCFERNITFISFEDDLLTWESTAEEDDKKMLIKHWGVINMFVKELFGFETKIKNIAKKKRLSEASDKEKVAHTEDNPLSLSAQCSEPNTSPVHNDADTGSMIEEVEMKSSCIAPDAGETEAAKEKDPSTLLEEPMIKAAMELFSPKKVRIKKNV